MRLTVTVKLRSKQDGVTKLPDGSYRVAVHVPAVEGRANARVCELLAKFFHEPKSAVTILHGTTARTKVVEIAL